MILSQSLESRDSIPLRLATQIVQFVRSTRDNLLFVCIVFASLILLDRPSIATSAQPPLNVLFILADDLGVHDIGCYGTDLHETPHIDQLARKSLLFHRAYSPAPVCTPTRASILTGKHPARLKMTIWSEGALTPPTDRALIPGKSLPDLPLSETTIAEKFQEHGYLTAMIGKWHLGDAAHGPEAQGFDLAIGGNHWGAPTTFFFPYRGTRSNQEYRYVPGLGYGKEGEYLTDRLTAETLKAIDFAQEQSRPFFIMLNHYAPHTPIEAKSDYEVKFKKKLPDNLNHKNPGYAAMIYSLDESIGRLMQHLQERNLTQNTVVIFTSDNGGYIGVDGKRDMAVTSNWPLRSGKASLYEGGIRVPLMVYWPDKKGMEQSCNQVVSLTDLHQTLLHALHSKTSDGAISSTEAEDGLDLTSLLDEPTKQLTARSLFFHYPHYYHAPPTTPCSAMLQYPWKLIYYYENDRSELYNLEQDPSEKIDLIAQDIKKGAELKGQLNRWLISVDGERPTQAPSPP